MPPADAGTAVRGLPYPAPGRARRGLTGPTPLRWGELEEIDDPAELETVFATPPAIHRFPGAMARRVQALCAALAEDYDADAAAAPQIAADQAKSLIAQHVQPYVVEGWGREQTSLVYLPLVAGDGPLALTGVVEVVAEGLVEALAQLAMALRALLLALPLGLHRVELLAQVGELPLDVIDLGVAALRSYDSIAAGAEASFMRNVARGALRSISTVRSSTTCSPASSLASPRITSSAPTISWASRPSFCARAVRSWERSANASWSARETACSSATFSAVSPIESVP